MEYILFLRKNEECIKKRRFHESISDHPGDPDCRPIFGMTLGTSSVRRGGRSKRLPTLSAHVNADGMPSIQPMVRST